MSILLVRQVEGELCSHSTAGVTIGRPHRVQTNQAFPPWGKVACIRRMRGSHSSEWRLYSTERGCFRRMLAHPTPHQSLSAEDVFRFRLRNRRCSADEEKLRETHRVSYSSPPRGKPKARTNLVGAIHESPARTKKRVVEGDGPLLLCVISPSVAVRMFFGFAREIVGVQPTKKNS